MSAEDKSEDLPVYVGTAGWSVPAHYADEVPREGSHLQRYAGRLNAVEINSSFARPHRRATYERWAETVPAAFRFSVKTPRTITHEGQLRQSGALLDRLCNEVGGLGDKLGVLLVQLPPSLPFDRSVAETFFAEVRARFSVVVALEPRHRSWFSTAVDNLLKTHCIARVAADPPPVGGADEPGGWDGLVYLRLHGSPRIYYSDYDPVRLADIRGRLDALKTKSRPIWCIFDNTAAFHAFGNALAIAG